MPINFFILLSLFATFLYLVGFLTFISDYEENKCEMTYMFEYPQYVRVYSKGDDLYPKYGLYAYSEGSLTQKARNMYFDGIPVLFIPGNGGSYKQVRSLSSVALRKSLNSRPGYHFNFFTVDLNDELSGLNGAVLYDQAKYVNMSIESILNLYYERPNPPKSIVLVGHSMGGKIATYVASTLKKDSNLISLVLTLTSPHYRPPVLLDYYMDSFYKDVNRNEQPNSSITISVSGGHPDFLVQPMLTVGTDLDIMSTQIPRVWLPADHLCILWCKQLVLALNRAIFDAVDIKTKQISTDRNRVFAAFKHHLVKHSGTKLQLADRYERSIYFTEDKGEWVEQLSRQYSVHLSENNRNYKYYMIRLVNHPLHSALTAVVINMESVEWAFACAAVHIRGQSRVCTEAKHLTHLSEIAPSSKYKRRILKINMLQLKEENPEVTHLVLRLPPADKPVILNVDVYGPGARKIPLFLSKIFILRKLPIIPLTDEDAIHYDIVVPDLYHVRNSYYLFVEPVTCKTPHNHHATASLIVPWANQNYHQHFTETERKPMHIRLYTSRPQHMSNESAIIRLTLDPACRYTVSIRTSLVGSLGQIARYNTPLLIGNVAAILLLTLRSQVKNIGEKERCSLFFTALKEGAKPYYFLTTIKLAAKILGSTFLSKYIPLNDWTLYEKEGSDFFFLPFIMYIVSVGIVWLLALSLSISLIVCESTVHKYIFKFFAKGITGRVGWSDWLVNSLQKLPFLVASILIVISWSTCGGLALCIGTFFYFLKLTQMSQDFIEGLVWKIFKSLTKKLKGTFCKKGCRGDNHKSELPIEDQLAEALLASNDARIEYLTYSSIDRFVPSSGGYYDSITPETPNQVSSKAAQETTEHEKKLEDIPEDENKENDEIICANSDKIDNDRADKNSSQSSETDQNRGIKEKQTENTENKRTKKDDDGKYNEARDKNSDDIKSENKADSHKDIKSWLAEILENNEIYFHFTMFLLWALVACLNVPSVLTWAHNFKFNRTLLPDPSFLPGLILSICAIPLWQLEFPKVERLRYEELGYFIYGCAFISLLYGSLAIYRLNYTLIAAIVAIVLHQLLGPTKKVEDDVKEKVDKEEPEHLFDKVKAKWE